MFSYFPLHSSFYLYFNTVFVETHIPLGKPLLFHPGKWLTCKDCWTVWPWCAARSPREKKSGQQCWDPDGTPGTVHLLKDGTNAMLSFVYFWKHGKKKKGYLTKKSVILVRRDIITCTLNHSNYSVILNWYSYFHIYPFPMITVDNSSLTQYLHICKLEGRGVYLYQIYRNRLCKGIVKNYYNIFLQRIGHVS